MASVPPPSRRGKPRPWYVALALVAASLFGITGVLSGCSTIGLYKNPRIDPASAPELQAITVEADRAEVVPKFERYHETLDAAKTRVFPLGVAELVLGIAALMLASRVMGGRASGRSFLLQILLAQAALEVALFAMTPDVRHASFEYALAVSTAMARSATDAANTTLAPSAVSALRQVPTVLLILRTTATLLVLLALTRPKALAFFEMGAEPDMPES